MLKTVYKQILEEKIGRPTDEEKMLIGSICEKYNHIEGRTKKLQMILNELKLYPDNDVVIKARKRVSLTISRYRKKSYYKYMDEIEVGVDDFINDYYAIRPNNDIYLFIYLVFLKNRKVVNKCTDKADLAYKYLFESIVLRNKMQLQINVSQLSKKDKQLYTQFKKRNGLVYSQMSFIQPKNIMTNYFCDQSRDYIKKLVHKDYENWIIEFKREGK